MAEHVWTVLCYKGCIDQYTNQVSLLDVVEAITVTSEGPLPEVPQGSFSCKLNLVSLWARSKTDVPEMPRCRVYLVTPDGSKKGMAEFEPDLKEGTRSRIVVRIDTLPYSGSGFYNFIVEQFNEATEKWKRVARIPFEIRLNQPQPETAATKRTRSSQKS